MIELNTPKTLPWSSSVTSRRRMILMRSVQKENMKPMIRIAGIAAAAVVINDKMAYMGPSSNRLNMIKWPRLLILVPKVKMSPEPNIYPSGIQASMSPNSKGVEFHSVTAIT
ncbi:hypothetical protein D3C81_1148770 [compost metagenome]